MPISTEGSGTPTMRPTTGSPVWGGVERTIYMPISTEGSSIPTMRPTTGSPVWRGGGGVGGENYLHAHIH